MSLTRYCKKKFTFRKILNVKGADFVLRFTNFPQEKEDKFL